MNQRILLGFRHWRFYFWFFSSLHTKSSQSTISTSIHYPCSVNGFITGTITSNHYEVFLPFLVHSPWTADLTHFSNSGFLLLLTTLQFSWNFGTQLLQTIFHAFYKPSAQTTQKTQLFYCCVCVCWGSHVIATQPVHWHTGCCLATVAVWTQREHCLYCRVFVGTCLLSRCLAKRCTCHSIYISWQLNDSTFE
jgi:hypothetical protein